LQGSNETIVAISKALNFQQSLVIWNLGFQVVWHLYSSNVVMNSRFVLIFWRLGITWPCTSKLGEFGTHLGAVGFTWEPIGSLGVPTVTKGAKQWAVQIP